jgi:hypothetical protein
MAAASAASIRGVTAATATTRAAGKRSAGHRSGEHQRRRADKQDSFHANLLWFD